MNIYALSVVLVVLGSSAYAELLLYGGLDHDEFLGCLECGERVEDSICNKQNNGNPHNTQSIFNQYGPFGDKHSGSSPWNSFSNDESVPIIVDNEGQFYGFFTINSYRSNAVGYSRQLGDIFKTANGDFGVLFSLMCG